MASREEILNFAASEGTGRLESVDRLPDADSHVIVQGVDYDEDDVDCDQGGLAYLPPSAVATPVAVVLDGSNSGSGSDDESDDEGVDVGDDEDLDDSDSSEDG